MRRNKKLKIPTDCRPIETEVEVLTKYRIFEINRDCLPREINIGNTCDGGYNNEAEAIEHLKSYANNNSNYFWSYRHYIILPVVRIKADLK